MQTQYINEMLNLPELEIYHILSIDADELRINAVPPGDRRCCPCRRLAIEVYWMSHRSRRMPISFDYTTDV